MKTKAGSQNRFLRFISGPIRALGKARDFYVRSMMGYATKVGNGSNYMGTTSANYSMDLPRSFSVNAAVPDNDDMRDLIRVASARCLADRIDVNNFVLQEQILMGQHQHPGSKLGAAGAKVMPPRSQSVGMARIDEEKPYAAGEITPGKSSKKSRGLFFRSRSYAHN